MQTLFFSLQTEEEALCCYQALFAILKNLTSLDQLQNNLPQLLSSFPHLFEQQRELALQIGQWFFEHGSFCNAMHAFANPEANDPNFGTVYNKTADHRSWIAMVNFFREVFDTAM